MIRNFIISAIPDQMIKKFLNLNWISICLSLILSLSFIVLFFPDRGYMVDDLVNQIGIKAVGADGKGLDISGIIVDNSGKHVIDLKTLKFTGELRFH